MKSSANNQHEDTSQTVNKSLLLFFFVFSYRSVIVNALIKLIEAFFLDIYLQFKLCYIIAISKNILLLLLSAGTGGSNVAAGGQSSTRQEVGSVVFNSSIYQPSAYGGNGGYGGSHQDAKCHPRGKSLGGRGGGIIHLKAKSMIQIDGKISANGLPSHGPRSGGGAGGSIYIKTKYLRGTGMISANGGAVKVGYTNCGGGGGGAGLIGIEFSNNSYTGSTSAHGGAGGFECGGAGITLWQNMSNSSNPVVSIFLQSFDKLPVKKSTITFLL